MGRKSGCVCSSEIFRSEGLFDVPQPLVGLLPTNWLHLFDRKISC